MQGHSGLLGKGSNEIRLGFSVVSRIVTSVARMDYLIY